MFYQITFEHNNIVKLKKKSPESTQKIQINNKSNPTHEKKKQKKNIWYTPQKKLINKHTNQKQFLGPTAEVF